MKSEAIAILTGNLAPGGAAIKLASATPELFQHEGPALVFDSLEDLEKRIDDPDLDVTPQTVMVLRNAGPIGAPGMPEAGALPIPKKLGSEGLKDMVRLSDARMSGTAFGTVVLHVSPEAAAGGPLALVATVTGSSSTPRGGSSTSRSATPSSPSAARNGSRRRSRRGDISGSIPTGSRRPNTAAISISCRANRAEQQAP